MNKRFLTISGFALIIYPFVFVADLMSLAAESTGHEPALLTLAATTFQWVSLLYPIIYIVCLLSFFVVRNEAAKRWLARIPLAYLILCAVLFFLWGFVEAFA